MNPKKNARVRIAALGDLHVRDSPGSQFRDLFADIEQHADILILCGDLTDQGLPREAEILARELDAIKLPKLGILGNHDTEKNQESEVKRILAGGKLQFLDLEPVEILGIGFAGAKGFGGGFDRHVLQPWGEETMKKFVQEAVNEALQLESSLAKLRTEHKVAVLHYAPIRQTVEGEPPEILPFLGSSRLAAPIDQFNVSVVFHGHAHSGNLQGKTTKGVPVYNVSLPLLRRANPKQPYVVVEL